MGRLRIFANEFVVAMKSGIPWLRGWSSFPWETLGEGKPCAGPSSHFLLFLQTKKEKRCSFLGYIRQPNPHFHLSQRIKPGQIYEKCVSPEKVSSVLHMVLHAETWINQKMKSMMEKSSMADKLQIWLVSLMHLQASPVVSKW